MVFSLKRTVCGHPWAGLLWETKFEEVRLEHNLEHTHQLGDVFQSTEKSQLFLSVHVDDVRMVGMTE